MSKRASLFTPRTGRWTAAATLALLGAGTAFHFLRPERVPRSVVIGFNDNPPYQSVGPDGSVIGLAAEVAREAARRRGITLKWVYLPEGPDSALPGGKNLRCASAWRSGLSAFVSARPARRALRRAVAAP